MSSILKPNATRHDIAIEEALKATAPDLGDVRNLTNPDACPAALLGWLAWAFSVDVWDPAWSEETKRAVIRGSIETHRTKGTLGALRRALEAVGVKIDVVEWFEDGGVPFTFRLDVLADDIFEADLAVNQAFLDQVSAIVDRVKPVRAHYGLRVGEGKDVTLTLRSGSRARVRDRRAGIVALPREEFASHSTITTGSRQRLRSRVAHSFQMEAA